MKRLRVLSAATLSIFLSVQAFAGTMDLPGTSTSSTVWLDFYQAIAALFSF